MTIHKEGRVLLFVLLIVLFGMNWAVAYFFPGHTLIHNILLVASIVFYLIILQFFRNPVFDISRNEKQVLAPADGKVVVIEETDEPEEGDEPEETDEPEENDDQGETNEPEPTEPPDQDG